MSANTIEQTVELIRSLIRIESISGNEQPLVDFFSDWCIKRFPKNSVTLSGRNIVIDLKGDGFNGSTEKTILLCSHYDTVPVCSGWKKDPFGAELEGETIFGLGANDALASVVTMTNGALENLAAIKQSDNRVILSFVCEEELGNKGFVSVEPTLPRYGQAIFGEPTALRIGYCMRGSVKLKVLVRGKSCHASRPHEGENAIFNLGAALQKIKNIPLKDDSPWGTATLEPVVIKGGTAENQIPDLIEILLDSRPTWKRNNEYIIEALRATGLDMEVIRNIRRPMAIATDHPLVKLAQAANPSAQLYPFGGSCDMAFSTAPSIVFGPGASERSHAADEHIKISELQAGVDSFATIIRRFCGELS